MITLHKLNGTEFILNDHHIETIEATPDSVVTLVNDKKYIVKESTGEIISKIKDYQAEILKRLQSIQ
ncbi:MAG: flagellar FlbD family protein [Spirochaetes bacterium]|nr:flagellar FlbD family protein [Spirochaetota bacterium]